MIRVFIILFLINRVQMASGQSAFDSKLEELAQKVALQIGQQGKVKVAVWHFVNTQGEITDMGKFIAEDFSVYFTNASKGTYQVMDRNHLNQLLKEHKLNAEGFIDPETAKELGRLKAVDAIITGTVDIFEKQLKVRLKVLDTETALQIAAEIGYLPVDENIADFLGVPGLNSGNQTSGTTNRGFNRPLNSNEQYNNPETVSKDCETEKIGDFCFNNSTKEKLMVQLNDSYSYKMTVDPGQTQCYYNLGATDYDYEIFRGNRNADGSITFNVQTTPWSEGKIMVEQCRSKTFVIK